MSGQGARPPFDTRPPAVKMCEIRTTYVCTNNYRPAPMPQDPQFVVALARGLELLSCFEPSRAVLNNGKLSRLTGLPPSSVSRLTHTLIKLGYLDYDASLGAYRLGFRVLSMHSHGSCLCCLLQPWRAGAHHLATRAERALQCGESPRGRGLERHAQSPAPADVTFQ